MPGKDTHQHGQLLDALAKPLTLKGPSPIEPPIKRATVILPEYSRHSQKHLAVFIHKVEDMLKLNLAAYPTGCCLQNSISLAMLPPHRTSTARDTKKPIIPRQL